MMYTEIHINNDIHFGIISDRKGENMNFEDIRKANEGLKTMSIKGKDYIPVNERVKAFAMLFPDGAIETDLVKYEDGEVIVKATIKDGERVLRTGFAHEVIGSSNINRTSALENCETSAVGRALGLLAIGIDTSIASYEEVNNAQIYQEGNALATPTEKAGLIATCRAKGMDINEILKLVGFDGNKQPEGMTAKQYGKAMSILNGGI